MIPEIDVNEIAISIADLTEATGHNDVEVEFLKIDEDFHYVFVVRIQGENPKTIRLHEQTISVFLLFMKNSNQFPNDINEEKHFNEVVMSQL